MDYRVIKYKTFLGKRELIQVELSSQSYGEWIIYQGDLPKFHICCFDESVSGKLIKDLLENK